MYKRRKKWWAKYTKNNSEAIRIKYWINEMNQLTCSLTHFGQQEMEKREQKKQSQNICKFQWDNKNVCYSSGGWEQGLNYTKAQNFLWKAIAIRFDSMMLKLCGCELALNTQHGIDWEKVEAIALAHIENYKICF